MRTLVHRFLLRFGVDLVPVGLSGSPYLFQIRSGLQDAAMLLNGCEAYQIMAIAKATEKLPGDLAEVGVFRGGSAKLISEVKANRTLYLFDTFEGLPDPTAADSNSKFQVGDYRTGMEQVRKYLEPYPGVQMYKGMFPASAKGLEDRRFSFVHLDVDLHDSTKASLEWFYPKMTPGGAILCHDYIHPGVRKAVDEFFLDKPEVVVHLPAGAHCLIVKGC